MRVAIISPIDNSLLSLVLCELLRREQGVELAGILLRRALDGGRIRQEWRRDGPRLLRKVWRKLIVGETQLVGSQFRTLPTWFEDLNLQRRSLKHFARNNRVPIQRFRRSADPAAVKFLQDTDVDLVLYAGGGIIRKPLLQASGQGILNCHMGLLPEFRGLDVIEWPLLVYSSGPPALGLTLHFMDEGIDTGPVLQTRPLTLQAGDTFQRIRDRAEPIMVEMMLDAVRSARDGILHPEPQQRSDGRQYFMLHPRMQEKAQQRLRQVAASLENSVPAE